MLWNVCSVFFFFFFLYSIFLDNILFPLIAFCFVFSILCSAFKFLSNLRLRNFVMLWKKLKNYLKTLKTHCLQCKQPLMTACHHPHHFVLLARTSVTLSRHCSLSFTASGRSSRLHPVSSHSCRVYGRPAFARPYVRVHKSTSLMSSSLLLQ